MLTDKTYINREVLGTDQTPSIICYEKLKFYKKISTSKIVESFEFLRTDLG